MNHRGNCVYISREVRVLKENLLEMAQWVVVGVSGVTCSGKTTIAQLLHHKLPGPSKLLTQDFYFYPEDSSHHVPAPAGLNHHNWEVTTSVDIEKMLKDIRAILGSPPSRFKDPPLEDSSSGGDEDTTRLSTFTKAVLLIDGFLLFGYHELYEMCDLRYFITLSRSECWQRRQHRHYEPPDPPGYFHHCVWPEYEKHLQYVSTLHGIRFLDGTTPQGDTCNFIFDDVVNLLEN